MAVGPKEQNRESLRSMVFGSRWFSFKEFQEPIGFETRISVVMLGRLMWNLARKVSHFKINPV